MGKIIVITSGKGGVGKTVATANIGVALAKLKKKVLLADFDIGLRNLDLMMGLHDVIVYDIMDVVDGRCTIEKAIFKFPEYGHLHMLAASQSEDKDFLVTDKFKNLFLALKNDYDYILIDCPAGIEKGFKASISCADSSIVMVMPEMSSIRDSDRVLGLMQLFGVSDTKILINRVRIDMIKRGDMLSIDEICDLLGTPPIGIIPEDEVVIKSQKVNTIAVLENSSSAGAEFRNIARRITGENVPITKLNDKDRGLLKRFFGA